MQTNSLWVCVIKVCSHFGATYITGKINAKDNLNIANFIQTLKIFFTKTTLQNFQILHTSIRWVSVNMVCPNGGATYFICKLITKNNLNITNVMQPLQNLLLQNCSTEFLDIAHSPWVCVIKVCSIGYAT